jgi:hypothetical protein
MRNYIVSVFPDQLTTVAILHVEYVPFQSLKLPNVSLRERNEFVAIAHLRNIEQLDLSLSDVVENIHKKMDHSELYMDCDLLVYQNESGSGLTDFMKLAGMLPIEIHASSGDLVSSRPRGWNVPRKDLVNALSVLMDTGRFIISQDEEDPEYTAIIENLQKQLQYYEESSERIDLLMPAAMGVWWIARQGAVQQPKQPVNKEKKYNPLSYGI